MKLLIATDFSEGSDHAGRYAIQLAAQIGATLSFIHAYKLGRGKSKLIPDEIHDSLEREGEFTAQKHFLKYLKHLRADLNEVVSIHPVLKEGKAEDAISEYADYSDVDLIIMGSGNTQSFKKKMLGNTATAILKKAPCPILIIPPDAEWKPISHLVYGTSFQEEDTRVPCKVEQLAMEADAHVSCVYVKTEDDVHGKIKGSKLERIFRLQEDPSNRIFFYTLINRNVLNGIREFSNMYKADLISLLLPRKASYKHWINGSLARSLIFRTQVPLLVAVQ